jgi:quinol monooxygenase YgiN
VLLVARLRPGPDDESFLADVRTAIAAMAGRPGHIATRVGRGVEDPAAWVLVSEWENVGSYRRALSSYEVRMASGVLASVSSEPSAFEVVESV